MKSKKIKVEGTYWKSNGVGPMPNAQLDPIPNAELPSLEEYQQKKRKVSN